jgi:hypothetical protein
MNKIILAKDLDHRKLGTITAGTPMEVNDALYAELKASGHIESPAEIKSDEEE